MSARCFVVERQNDKDSTSNLSEFGEIVYVFKAGQDRPSVFDTAKLSEAIFDVLDKADYRSDRDYIVLSGSLNMMASLVAVAINYQGISKALMFDFAGKKYRQVEIG